MSIKAKILRPMIIVAVIAATAILLSTILLFSGFVDRNIEAGLDRAMLFILNEINLKKTQSMFAALYTANDNVIIDALTNRNREELINRAVEIYEYSGLTVFTITDERGIVQARGQFPGVYGDDLSDRIVTKTALEGRFETFIERGPIIPLVVVSGIPVYNAQGTLIGAITAGFRLDSGDFVDNLKKMTGCEISIFAGDGRRIATTLIDEKGNRAVGAKAPEYVFKKVMAGETVTGQLYLAGQEILAKYKPLYATGGEIIGMLFAGYFLTERTQMIWSFIAAGFLILLILLTISVPAILFITGRIAAPITKNLDQLHYDILTGIYNRRYFEEHINKIIKSLARSGNVLSLMMVDIDSFKNFNDTYGHRKGDECLKLVAQALAQGITRADDFVARYGGEEFAVVLPNTDEIGAHLIADRVLESIRCLNIPHEKNDAANYVTVSIGVTSGNVCHTQSWGDYVNRADEMLYLSKQNGRNRYSYLEMKGSSPMTLSSAQKTIQTLQQIKEISDALKETAISFLSKSDLSFEDIMAAGVSKVVDFMCVDRLTVWRNFKKPDGLHVSQIYRWDRDSGGTTPPISALSDISYAESLPGWENVLSNGEVINGPVRLMFDADLLNFYGVVSIFAVPVFIDNNFWGAVLYADLHNERFFDEAGAEIMRSAAVLFANAIIRAGMMEKIENSLFIVREANRSKSEFLARMSHEMLTPMNAILGMTQIAKMRSNTDNLGECLGEIDKASRKLLRLINDLLEISGKKAGAFVFADTVFSFNNMLSLISNRINPCITEKQLTLGFDIDPSIPDQLKGDENRLSQVISYLLENAVKFTREHGEIRLFASALNESGDDFILKIEISDNGIGISKEQQGRIFNIFEQADGSLSRKYDGAGLGLPMVKYIIEKMGGKIWVESEPGKGAKFTFTCRMKAYITTAAP